jgi:hypothetical protein
MFNGYKSTHLKKRMLYLVSKKNRKEMRVCFFARYEKKDRNNNSKANNNIENKQTNKQQEKKERS